MITPQLIKLTGMIFFGFGVILELFCLISIFRIQRSKNTSKKFLKNKKKKFKIQDPKYDKHDPVSHILPVNDYGEFNLIDLAGKIAKNIYIKCYPHAPLEDGADDPLEPLETSGLSKPHIDKLYKYGWIQIFLHEHWIDDFDDEKIQILEKEIIKIFNVSTYLPKIEIFLKQSKRNPTAFDLRLLPMIPHDIKTLDCNGYIFIGKDKGEVRVPGCNGISINVGTVNIQDTKSTIFPLSKILGNTITIGPELWCHIRTNRRYFDSILTIGWTKPNDFGIIGRMKLLKYNGPKDLYIRNYNKRESKPFDRYYDFPITDASVSKYTLFRKEDDKEYNLFSISYPLARPGKIELYGITLSRKLDRNGWKDSTFKELLNTSGIKDDIKGISQANENGCFAVIEGLDDYEVHYCAGSDSDIGPKGDKHTISANQSTFSINKPLSDSQEIEIIENNKINITYQRTDYRKAKNYNIFIKGDLYDFEDYLNTKLGINLNLKGNLSKIDIACCHSKPDKHLFKPDKHLSKPDKHLSEPDKHLYSAITELNNKDMGWLIRKGGGIEEIFKDGDNNPLDLDYNREVVGPIENITNNLFKVKWAGGKDTPVFFEIDDHGTQIEKYLADGFCSMDQKIKYYTGGVFTNQKDKSFITDEESYISTGTFKFRDGDNNHTLNFNVRDYCCFFDKDSFVIFYHPEEKAYVVKSKLHLKERITPKTVFMVVPKGDNPVIGSHALPYVRLTEGINYIILPGLTFKFIYGVGYY
ncbi:hypothetical protein GMMP1_140076 [Candidatus Magnetomoraceae bacterium gMMP-1]